MYICPDASHMCKHCVAFDACTSQVAMDAPLMQSDPHTLLYRFQSSQLSCIVDFFNATPTCRMVADLAAQLVSLGPWKIVYDQLRVMNAAWFEQHAINAPGAVQLAGTGK